MVKPKRIEYSQDEMEKEKISKEYLFENIKNKKEHLHIFYVCT